MVMTHQGRQGEGQALGPQGKIPNSDYRWVIPEQHRSRFPGQRWPYNGNHNAKTGGELQGKGKALPQPGKFPSPIAEAAHGLEALAKADDHGGSKEVQPGHNGHGGNGGVPKGAGGHVQENGGSAGGTLPHQGRCAPGGDFLEKPPRRMDILQPDGNVAPRSGSS